MTTAQRYRALLNEALEYQARAFEHDEDVSGADLVDWFSQWRLKVGRAFVAEHYQEQQQALDL